MAGHDPPGWIDLPQNPTLGVAQRAIRARVRHDLYGDPANACFRLDPEVAFGLTGDDFTGSPTRWTFRGSDVRGE